MQKGISAKPPSRRDDVFYLQAETLSQNTKYMFETRPAPPILPSPSHHQLQRDKQVAGLWCKLCRATTSTMHHHSDVRATSWGHRMLESPVVWSMADGICAVWHVALWCSRISDRIYRYHTYIFCCPPCPQTSSICVLYIYSIPR